MTIVFPVNRDDLLEVIGDLSGEYTSIELYDRYRKTAIAHNRVPANHNRWSRQLTRFGGQRSVQVGTGLKMWHLSRHRTQTVLKNILAAERRIDEQMKVLVEHNVPERFHEAIRRGYMKDAGLPMPVPDYPLHGPDETPPAPTRTRPRPLKGPKA